MSSNKVIPVEVKLQARSGKVSRSMRSFIETYKPEMALIVSYNHIKDKRTINGCTVHFIDIMGMWKLLVGRDFEV